MSFSPEQADDALAVMQQYLDHPPDSDGRTPEQRMAVLDQERANWIDTELKPLIGEFLDSRQSLEIFKWSVNAFNIQHKGWGFLGPSGQLFFNMLVNTARDASECEREVREAIRLPADEESARSQMRKFEQFVRRVRQAHKTVHGTMRGCPKIGSIPFFVSYFWQIQRRDIWPIYYANAVNTMVDVDLWKPTGDNADDYIAFKHLYEALAQLFTEKSGKPFGFYQIEHVFWFTGAHPYVE